MSDYVEKTDLYGTIRKKVNNPAIRSWLGAIIAEHPAADAVPVVRCKDCKYFEPKNSLETQGVCMCGEKEMNYGGEFYPFADDYCSYGERRAKHDAVRAIAENEV